MQNDTQSRQKVLRGTVKSNAMDKTVVVEVARRTLDPAYKKYITLRKRYKAHDETNQCNVGDVVDIVECRPLSRDKRWRVQSVVERPD